MDAVQTANPPGVETCEAINSKQQLYRLLEEALEDVKKGNYLTEEEMDKELDLM